MISFDPSEFGNWVDKPDASHQFPELIRRLSLATVPQLHSIAMPSGSSVWRGGWDGVLDVAEGNQWVPNGRSVWELSCNSKPQRKADCDYRKRKKETHTFDPAQTTFVFVTPRRWSGKLDWAEDRRRERHWSDVQVLDADDLQVWLEQGLAVASWFARLMGKLPDTGVVPLDEWWETWSAATQPCISPDLVLAGRRKHADTLGEWVQGQADAWYVQGETSDEAIAFLAASAHAAPASWGATFLAKALLVQTAEAWRSLECHSCPLVLIRDFTGPASSQRARVNGHHVLIPLDLSQEPKGPGQTLPHFGRDETVEALMSMGFSEHKSRSLIWKTARRLSILYRSLVEEAGHPGPEWAENPAASLTGLILVGQWEENSDGDGQFIADLMGKSYEEVERDITVLAAIPDSPVVKVVHGWRLASHAEAWHLLAPRLTSSLTARFTDLAVAVLQQMSPAFKLPKGERFLAPVEDKTLPHSDTLRQGIVCALALMGVHPDRAQLVDSVPRVPSKVVHRVLAEGGWQIWATLAPCLATLAEAAPDAFLDEMERELSDSADSFNDLFTQEEPPPFFSAPQAGLLQALECLAWSKTHFARVATILARLAQLDPGGQARNRPMESLKSLFLPWIRFSETSDTQRLQTLQTLLSRYPQIGWRLTLGVYPSSTTSVWKRTPPNWRPWGHDTVLQPTAAESSAYCVKIEDFLLDHVQHKVERWADLVHLLFILTPAGRLQVLDALAEKAESLKKHPNTLDLWAAIRHRLSLCRRNSDAAQAVSAEEVTKLADVYARLTPSDPVSANSWLFDSESWLLIDVLAEPDHSISEIPDRKKYVEEARQAAIRAVYGHGGHHAIAALMQATAYPGYVGTAVARILDTEQAVSLALPYIGSPDHKPREFAHAILAELFRRLGWRSVERILHRLKPEGVAANRVAALFLSAEADSETWQRLGHEPQNVQEAYWTLFPVFQLHRANAHDLAFGVQRLMEVHRTLDIVRLLAYSGIDIADDLVAAVLEQLPFDLARHGPTALYPQFGDDLACLFAQLDRSDHIPNDAVARLELPLVPVLVQDRQDRPNLSIHREVFRNPAVFADLVSFAFGRADAQIDSVGEEQVSRDRAKIAFDILWKIRGFPGLNEEGTVNTASLETWVNEARRLCQERGRAEIGEEEIGKILSNAPAGADGVWPCEPVRDLLDKLGSQHVGTGFATGKLNLRGVTRRAVFEGGDQERVLAEKFHAYAERITATWPFTAQLLRKIATEYKSDAQGYDQQAARLE